MCNFLSEGSPLHASDRDEEGGSAGLRPADPPSSSLWSAPQARKKLARWVKWESMPTRGVINVPGRPLTPYRER